MNVILNEGKREKQAFENHAQAKLKLFQDALNYCQEFVTIEKKDYKEFQSNFKSYLVKKLKGKCGQFANVWTDAKVLEFFEASESMINTIQSRYDKHKQIELNADYNGWILPDFGVYAVTDIEIKRLATVTKLLEALDELKKDRWGVDYILIAKAVNHCIDATAKDGRPSQRYVKQRERR
jgi:hypothetical protein